jgi:CHAT domain-containing protein
MAARAIEKGAPTVVGALQAVPDSMGPALATAFYRAAREYPVGEALRLARARLEHDGYNPACLGLFVQYGDPSVRISPSGLPGPVPEQVRAVSWPAYLIRWLAARRTQDRDQCLARLRAEHA